MNIVSYSGAYGAMARITTAVNQKAPLPLDGSGNVIWGTNGQVLASDGSGNTYWTENGSGGSSGHTIENSSGTDMTARTHLQFKGADVTDDPTNDRTLVTVPTYSDATQSADGLMSAADKTKIDGIHTGADAVEWTQIQQSGTKIAEVEINGTTTDVYAPDGGGGGGVADVEVNGTSVVDANDVAKITSYREVTQAEYNALPDTKYSDGVAYFINDDVSTERNAYPPLVFSTYEREVGVWVDGKPLYQKTYPVTYDRSNVEVPLGFTPDALMFVPEGTFNQQASSGNVVNYGFYVSSTDRCQIYFRRSEDKLIIMSVNDSSIMGSGYVTIRYTKPTDTAGSGDWTTQGTHAVHYSTDEQIIGSWIDGKPLYEKTVVAPSEIEISSSSWTPTGLYIPNGGVVVECSGIDIGGGYQGSLLAYIASATNEIFLQATRNASAYVKWFTIRYTKTTD